MYVRLCGRRRRICRQSTTEWCVNSHIRYCTTISSPRTGSLAQASACSKQRWLANTIIFKAQFSDRPSVYCLTVIHTNPLSVAQGVYAEAELLHKRSLAIQEKSLGPEHPDVASSLDNLAILLCSQVKIRLSG